MRSFIICILKNVIRVIISRIRRVGHVARIRKITNMYNIFVGRSEWMKPLREIVVGRR